MLLNICSDQDQYADILILKLNLYFDSMSRCCTVQYLNSVSGHFAACTHCYKSIWLWAAGWQGTLCKYVHIHHCCLGSLLMGLETMRKESANISNLLFTLQYSCITWSLSSTIYTCRMKPEKKSKGKEDAAHVVGSYCVSSRTKSFLPHAPM